MTKIQHDTGWWNMADLMLYAQGWDIKPVYLQREYDANGYERTQRINGGYQCPKCELWWPCVEEPDCWTMNQHDENKWDAEGWFGGVVCEDCGLLMIDQPDGTAECYSLRDENG